MKTKTYVILAFTFLSINSYAQSIDTTFYPEKAEDISEEIYRDHTKKLESTYSYINDNPLKKLGFHQYWNISVCYANMDVDNSTILDLLLKAKKADSAIFCKIINYQYNLENKDLNKIRFHKILGNKYLELLNECKGIEMKAQSLDELFKEKEGLDLTGLNKNLIDRLILLLHKDQTYRGNQTYLKNREKQNKLDREVEKELITIFNEFGYPTKELVGEHYSTLGCLLLEHSGQPKTQEKYIPLVANAFQNNKKIRPYFKMLLDRYYMRTTGKQIFGSHANIPFQSDKVISEVKNKYGFTKDEPIRKIKQNSKTITIKRH